MIKKAIKRIRDSKETPYMAILLIVPFGIPVFAGYVTIKFLNKKLWKKQK